MCSHKLGFFNKSLFSIFPHQSYSSHSPDTWNQTKNTHGSSVHCSTDGNFVILNSLHDVTQYCNTGYVQHEDHPDGNMLKHVVY
jgi:hypothetical protein